ncbi:MAG: PAS domain S-box protein [Methanobacterium sp.]|uniref:PAS domain-containing protein n=1 Tax=Methanobacterium sp. TaxID=2164 RepID=UPI003D658DAA|nr:PAS domain S-box protein [Methanobacterium sp.]
MRENITNVLIIEDNPGDVIIIREMLKDAVGIHFNLLNVGNLSDGLKILVKEDIDILLLDLNLPDSHGIDTFIKMNQNAPNMPIIILTGLTDEELAINAVAEGAQDYLVKGQIESQLLAKSIKYAIERKNIERKLRESEEKYRLIVEKAQSGVFLMNSNNKLTYVNQSIAKMLGYTVSEMLKKDISNFTDRRGEELINYYLNKTEKLTGQTYELKLLNKQGVFSHVLVSTNPLFKADGTYLGAISILIDISSRKSVERSLVNALKDKDENLFLIMGSMIEAMKPLIQNEYKEEEYFDKFA